MLQHTSVLQVLLGVPWNFGCYIIAGKRKLAARPGVVEGKKAVRIIRPLTADDMFEEDLSYKEDKK